MANVDHISQSGFGVVAAIKNFFSAVSESIELAGRYQRTLRELECLSDRELADMNISRSDITRIALDAVYGTNSSEFKRG